VDSLLECCFLVKWKKNVVVVCLSLAMCAVAKHSIDCTDIVMAGIASRVQATGSMFASICFKELYCIRIR
jgi:hypothetical protein